MVVRQVRYVRTVAILVMGIAISLGASGKGTMERFKNNLLVRFSVVSLVIMAILALVISRALHEELSRNVELLEQHGAVMMSGSMIQPPDPFSIPSLSDNVNKLQWLSTGAIGGGFAFLYASLVLIVWGGSRTIRRQHLALATANEHLQAANGELESEVNERKRAEGALGAKAEELAVANARLAGENAERRQAEEALRATQEHRRAIFDAIPDQLYDLDRAGRFLLSVGPRGADDTASEPPGNSLYDAFPLDIARTS